jgi:hypothetical protein
VVAVAATTAGMIGVVVVGEVAIEGVGAEGDVASKPLMGR